MCWLVNVTGLQCPMYSLSTIIIQGNELASFGGLDNETIRGAMIIVRCMKSENSHESNVLAM